MGNAFLEAGEAIDRSSSNVILRFKDAVRSHRASGFHLPKLFSLINIKMTRRWNIPTNYCKCENALTLLYLTNCRKYTIKDYLNRAEIDVEIVVQDMNPILKQQRNRIKDTL